MYVAVEGTEGLTLAKLQAGYTFDKADMEALAIKSYPARDGSGDKWKLAARDFSVTGFPSADIAAEVTSIKVTAAPTK